VVAKAGKITAADVKREAPAKAPRVNIVASISISKALRVLLAECDQQGETMVFEIRCETIAAIRAAL
jgi:hypothetical protein